MLSLLIFFFFSSRRRHTRCGRDWSSDVCSSDLDSTSTTQKTYNHDSSGAQTSNTLQVSYTPPSPVLNQNMSGAGVATNRSEERRVGKECRSRRETEH